MKTTYKMNLLAAALVGVLAFSATALFAQNAPAATRPPRPNWPRNSRTPSPTSSACPSRTTGTSASARPNAMKYTANIQPVVPISISEDWNLIIRTIMPVIYAEAPVNNGGAGHAEVIPAWATSRRAFSCRPRNPWAAGFWAPVRSGIIPQRPTARWAPACGAPGRPSWRCGRNMVSPTASWPTISGPSPVGDRRT